MIETISCEPSKINVTLLKGGTSGEREVSLASGAACAQALREEGFTVTEIDTADADMLSQIIASNPDVVFIALHGKDGEDGCIQGLCELLHVPYTGPGVLASALAMDKTRAKVFYKDAGLPTAAWVTLHAGQDHDAKEVMDVVGGKCVVKPTNEGSALGVHIVETPEELESALDEAFQHGDTVLVESYISGTEVTAAVLGGANPEALPVIEIVPQESSEFYDYTAKYAQGGAQHIIPARLDVDTYATCQRNALAAHEALGCYGVSRTDMIVDGEGTCWVLETNTIPGMTATSLLPDAAREIGISFQELCRMFVELALMRG